VKKKEVEHRGRAERCVPEENDEENPRGGDEKMGGAGYYVRRLPLNGGQA